MIETDNHEAELEEIYRQDKAEFLATDKPYGEYSEVANKMRGFLAIAGQKKCKKTGERYYEHIPESVFGVSSDEMAGYLGKSEGELMTELTDNLKSRTQTIHPYIPKIRTLLSAVERVIKREKKRIQKIKDKFGCIFYSELAVKCHELNLAEAI